MQKRYCPTFRNIFLIILILIFSISPLALGNGGIKIEPARFLIEMEPGSRTTEVITVTNTSARTLQLTAVNYDWELSDNYKLITHRSGTRKDSLEDMLRFNPRSFSLPPGESQLVRFTITFPPGEENRIEHRGIIFFEQEDRFQDEGVGASVTAKVGTTVYATPMGQSFTFHILDSVVLKTPNGEYAGGLLTYNESSRHARFTVDYQIINSGGRLINEGQIEEKIVMPGEERGFILPLEVKLTPGRYELHLTCRFTGQQEKLTETVPFTVK